MTSSDIIAITALIVSLVTTLANLVANHFTNRANNRAKLQEIAFEKRLDAFREIYDLMAKYNDVVVAMEGKAIKEQSISEEEYTKIYDNFRIAKLKLMDAYDKNRLFLTQNIEREFRKYMDGGSIILDVQGKGKL